MNAISIAVDLLAWAFGVHIPIVYTVLGLLWLLPTLEVIGVRTNNQHFINAAANMSNYLILIYAIGGVFGTIITVFLAGLYPIFTNAAGLLLWPVWAIAIVSGVVIALPLIGFYNRSRGRLSMRAHIIIGYLAAIFATVIPAMFRLVFAVVNYPLGVEVIKDPNSLIGFDLVVKNYAELFANPTYPPLLLATIFGALALTAILISSVYDWKWDSTKNEMYDVVSKFMKKLALAFGAIYVIGGVWYLYEVYQYSPTVIWSILGHPPSYLPSAFYSVYQPTLILSGWFYALIALGVITLITLLASFRVRNKILAAINFIIPLSMVDIAEVMNLVAHLPYAIVPPVSAAEALVNNYGLTFALQVANTLKASTFISTLDVLGTYISQYPALLYLADVIFVFFNIMIAVTIYFGLVWRSKQSS
ncbi:MAG: cytochrome ubiquinol oxidase subunit I [Sulfolobaceae archaeon]|nr:cytochrome ubiquinol oxidase subunit I [Sulfolobaceae archaeon]